MTLPEVNDLVVGVAGGVKDERARVNLLGGDSVEGNPDLLALVVVVDLEGQAGRCVQVEGDDPLGGVGVAGGEPYDVRLLAAHFLLAPVGALELRRREVEGARGVGEDVVGLRVGAVDDYLAVGFVDFIAVFAVAELLLLADADPVAVAADDIFAAGRAHAFGRYGETDFVVAVSAQGRSHVAQDAFAQVVCRSRQQGGTGERKGQNEVFHGALYAKEPVPEGNAAMDFVKKERWIGPFGMGPVVIFRRSAPPRRSRAECPPAPACR